MNYFSQYIYCTNISTVLCHILRSINQTYSGDLKNKLKLCNWEYVQLLFLNVTCLKHFNKKYEMSFCLSNTIEQDKVCKTSKYSKLPIVEVCRTLLCGG